MPGWAGLRFRKSRDQKSILLKGFPFKLQHIGTLEAFLIHNSSQLPRTFGIRIFFRVVSCDGWFVAKPLAGGKVGKKNAVEDDKRDPPDYSESIYAVPWNKGEHDNKTQQVHHIGSERAFVLRS